MARFTTKWEREWNRMQRQEYDFLRRGRLRKESALNRLLARRVPDGLQEKLDIAFAKAFELIFEKGTGVIELTYNKDRIASSFDEKEEDAAAYSGGDSLRQISRDAQGSQRKNLLLSGIEGIGLGALGIGLPDIPLFAGVLLKGVYEVALNYGYQYNTEEEKYFILKIIEIALLHGRELDRQNDDLNRLIEKGWGPSSLPEGYSQSEQIQYSADALSKELLYMKFLQGLPLVGTVGGAYDAIYMQKILKYADVKYHRRFLLEHDGDGDTPFIA